MRYTAIQKNLFNLVLRTGWLTHESFYRSIFNSERLEEIDFESKYSLYDNIGSAYLAYSTKEGDSFWERFVILSINDYDKELGIPLGNIETVYTSKDLLMSFEYQIRNSKLPVFNDSDFLLKFAPFDHEKESFMSVPSKCSYLKPIKKKVGELVEKDRHLGAVGLLLLFGTDKSFSQKLAKETVTKSRFNLPSKRGGSLLNALIGDTNHVQKFLKRSIPQFKRLSLNDDLTYSDVETLIRKVKDVEDISFDLKVACIHLIFLNKYRKINNAFSRESEKVIKELLNLRINGVIDWNEFHGCIYLLGYSVSNSNLLNYKVQQQEIKITYSPLYIDVSKKDVHLNHLLDNNFGANWRLHFSQKDANMSDFEFRIKCASGWLTVGELSQIYLRGDSSDLQLNGVVSEYERINNGAEIKLSKISRQIEKYGPIFFDSVKIWNVMSDDR